MPWIPASASGAIPTSVARTGTSHPSASSTASPNPSRSEVTSTALAAFSDYLDWLLPGLASILGIVHLILSFGLTAVLFAMIFKILPDSPVEWEEVWLGAVIAALLFTLGKHLISLYIGSSNMAIS